MAKRDFFHTGLNTCRSCLETLTNDISTITLNGTNYFADSTISQSGDGKSWANAFKTLPEAVLYATDRNDVINVAPGDYDADAVINITTQGLTIRGPRGNDVQNKAMIYSGDAGHLMTINAHEVVIDGISFSAVDNTFDAIRVGTTMSPYKVTIRNCRFDGWSGEHGIYQGGTYDAPDLLIEDNLFRSWDTGAIRIEATRAMVRRNKIILVGATSGIIHVPTGGSRPDTSIIDNVIFGTYNSDTGIEIVGTPTESLFHMARNHVVGCDLPVTLSKYTNWYVGNYWGKENWRYVPDTGRSAAEARGAFGNLFYVDVNIETTGLDGRCWASAFDTIAVGLAAADTDAALHRNWAKRNTVYVSGDGFTETLVLAAEKSDLVGVGYQLGTKPLVTGNFTIGTAVPGFRIFNMGFVGTTTAPVITFPADMNYWELHDVDIYKSEPVVNTSGISSLGASRGWVMKGCNVYADVRGGRNTIGVNFDGDAGVGLMDNCFIEAAEGMDFATEAEQTVLKNSQIIATALCLDDDSDEVNCMNMNFISETAAGAATATGCLDWNAALAANCYLQAAATFGPIPNLVAHS